MPVPMLKTFAKKSGKSLEDLERYWSEAKEQAAKDGKPDNYAYIVGIVKRRANIKENIEMPLADRILENWNEEILEQSSSSDEKHTDHPMNKIVSDAGFKFDKTLKKSEPYGYGPNWIPGTRDIVTHHYTRKNGDTIDLLTYCYHDPIFLRKNGKEGRAPAKEGDEPVRYETTADHSANLNRHGNPKDKESESNYLSGDMLKRKLQSWGKE